MQFNGTAAIWREGDWFVATCIENNVASQGKTMESAMDNLKEALSLYYENETIPRYSTRFIAPLELELSV